MRRLLGPPPALSRLQSKAPATELGTSCLSLSLLCFAVAFVGGHRDFCAAPPRWGGRVVTGQPLKISLRDGHLGIITFTNLKRAFLSFESGCATWAFVKRANGNDRSCGGHLPPSMYSALPCTPPAHVELVAHSKAALALLCTDHEGGD